MDKTDLGGRGVWKHCLKDAPRFSKASIGPAGGEVS